MCWWCLDCNKPFKILVETDCIYPIGVDFGKGKDFSTEYWEKIETINISADKTPIRIIY